MPDARVTGAVPANALRALASANRVRSSPISPRIRAPEHGAQAGEAGQDGRVGVLRERLAERVFQLDDVGHRGVEGAQVRERGLAHGLLDQVGLAELLGAQPGQDPLDLVVDVAAAPAPDQRRPQRRRAAACGPRPGWAPRASVARASRLVRSSKVASRLG